MDFSSKDALLVVVGFALSILGSNISFWWTRRSFRARREAAADAAAADASPVTADATGQQGVLVRAFYWFVLGNMMFAVSGVAFVVDIFNLYSVSALVSAGTSIVALLLFAVSLYWLRLYLRQNRPAPAAVAATSPQTLVSGE